MRPATQARVMAPRASPGRCAVVVVVVVDMALPAAIRDAARDGKGRLFICGVGRPPRQAAYVRVWVRMDPGGGEDNGGVQLAQELISTHFPLVHQPHFVLANGETVPRFADRHTQERAERVWTRRLSGDTHPELLAEERALYAQLQADGGGLAAC